MAEGNWRWEHRGVEGACGEVDEHHCVKAELRDPVSSLSGGRRRLAPTEPQRLRGAEQNASGYLTPNLCFCIWLYPWVM
jgi:hypothetical protein